MVPISLCSTRTLAGRGGEVAARHVGMQVMTLIASCNGGIFFVETLLERDKCRAFGLLCYRALLLFVALFFFPFVSGFHGDSDTNAMQKYRENFLCRKETEHLLQSKPFAEEIMNYMRNGTFCHRGLER